MTLQMLFSCSVLASCMRLTEHPQDEVSNTAKATIKHWRSQVLSDTNVVYSSVLAWQNSLAFHILICCSGHLMCISWLFT